MKPGDLVPWILETGKRWQELGAQEKRIAS
jgi:hypothetical protein